MQLGTGTAAHQSSAEFVFPLRGSVAGPDLTGVGFVPWGLGIWAFDTPNPRVSPSNFAFIQTHWVQAESQASQAETFWVNNRHSLAKDESKRKQQTYLKTMHPEFPVSSPS